MKDFERVSRFAQHIIVGSFFIVLFITGIVIFKDYGVYLDEHNNERFGRRWTDYVYTVVEARSLSVPIPSIDAHDLIHGPIFEVFLALSGDLFRLKDSRDILLMRRLCVFLLFYIGIIFFYFFCRKTFRSWRVALLGCLFFVLSPRIFAEAFYNSVDIPFLVFFIISLVTLFLFLDMKTVALAGIHALVCAILVNVRPMGIFLPGLTVLFLLFEIIHIRSSRSRWEGSCVLMCFILFSFVLAVAFNPFLWAAPFERMNDMIRTAATFKWEPPEPWYYGPRWIAVSTPVLYGVLFLIGILVSVRSLFVSLPSQYLARRNTIILFLCFFLPLIVSVGKLYGGWRHLYFIYPIFLIFAIMGAQYVWQSKRFIARVVLIGSLILGLLGTAFFMVRNHPYQNIYFNRFAGKTHTEIGGRFGWFDYWALSIRGGLEYILKTDNDAVIPVCFNCGWADFRYVRFLPLEQRERLVSTNCEQAKYVLSYPFQPQTGYFSEKKFYSIAVDGLMIMDVYKLVHLGFPCDDTCLSGFLEKIFFHKR
ncbi:MAG: glycosyltransferase family 39 protein [Candidatus Omnitrophica bacterium]|nr:glycosyltransferase family 39 protein [Candidatus Omnitrophota bacterium]